MSDKTLLDIIPELQQAEIRIKTSTDPVTLTGGEAVRCLTKDLKPEELVELTNDVIEIQQAGNDSIDYLANVIKHRFVLRFSVSSAATLQGSVRQSEDTQRNQADRSRLEEFLLA